MSTSTQRPTVWDSEHRDDIVGMDGHHDVKQAQDHVDHAMREEWGITDARFVVDRVELRPAGPDPSTGDPLGPWTLVYGEYVDDLRA
jgi:hypothetical protein